MANNPYVNKVIFGSTTLVDLTDTTATPDKILTGYGAYGADGAWMNGTATGGESIPDGDNLAYGFTDGALPIVGTAQVDSAHVWDDTLPMMTFGIGRIGIGRVV